MDKSGLKKIGILGGTFDPPHLAHLRIAEEVREAYLLDKIFFIPASVPPHKKNYTVTPFKDRLKMVELAIQSNNFFEALDIEKDIIPSYTLKTLQKLKETYPEVEKFLIIGWDSFCEFETWWNYEKIVNFANIIVIPRRLISWEKIEEYFYKKVKELWAEEAFNRVYFFKIKTFDISSTLIRNLYKEGKSIRYLVPDSVFFYIQEKGFYRS